MPELSPAVLSHYVSMSMARRVPVELTLKNGATVSGRVRERVIVPPRDECGLEFLFEGAGQSVHLADVESIRSLTQ